MCNERTYWHRVVKPEECILEKAILRIYFLWFLLRVRTGVDEGVGRVSVDCAAKLRERERNIISEW